MNDLDAEADAENDNFIKGLFKNPDDVSNTSFILSFGGGASSVSNVSFPSVASSKLDYVNDIFIFAFDTTFEHKYIREAFKTKVYSRFISSGLISSIGGIYLYIIASTIPSSTVLGTAKHTYALQQPGQSLLYYKDATCTLDSDDEDKTKTWIELFTKLSKHINTSPNKVLIHNDAWWNQNPTFSNANLLAKLSVTKIGTLLNFERLCIIPHVLLNTIDNEKLYLIKSIDRDKSILVPFIHPNSVQSYPFNFTKKANLNYLASRPNVVEDAPVNAAANAKPACGGAGGGKCRTNGGGTRKKRTRRNSRKTSKKHNY